MSITDFDFFDLSKQLIQIEKAEIDMLHLDIMDGNYVPNISIGPHVVKSIRRKSKLFFDVHLMVKKPETMLVPFIDSGADLITVHAETSPHLHRTLSEIKKAGLKAGIALNPSTPLSYIENVLDLSDLILLMTVNPGFGGQKFIPSMLEKIRKLKSMIDNHAQAQDKYKAIEIQVDGGINEETAPLVLGAGASVLVMGSAVSNSGDIHGYISKIKKNFT